jgi:glycosyltransferase involved in cell wall biosynthesis
MNVALAMNGQARPAKTVRLDHVGVIIPAYNEEASLPLVLRDLPDVGRVVVVNNASTDATARVAREAGATVVDEPRRGYGSACLAGIVALSPWAQAIRDAPAVIVFLDGDYADHPDWLPRLVEPVLAGQADFVLGARTADLREPGAMPPQSVCGNRLACFLMRLLWGVSFNDLGPFRAIRFDTLHNLGMEDTNFGWTVEMQIKAVVAGLRIMEIPVPYRRRIGTSKISGTISGTIRAGTKILSTIARYAWKTRRSQRRATVA